ncbi:AraC-type DNA-binding protein [Shimia gijangensis]|uniref:AraC-type DNA-binding protein n=1 Tax=Shimia gijangensis TaxID=1470563 RepID=A0A1M6D7S4_9RHOB|nr:AraC family transcriptional regulator [Shimia gijangensis]SHI69201.1 AraC-type DNA-binding protein [Shimia gijangensis]
MNNIRAQRMLQFLQYVDSETGSCATGDEALKDLNLSRGALEAPGCDVDPEQEARLVDAVCDVLRDNLFATSAGLAFRDTFTLTAYIAKYSQTLRDAIENSSRFFSVLDPSFAIGLQISSNSAFFTLECLDQSMGRHHRFLEYLLFAALGRMRTVTQTDFFPLEIRFKHDAKNIASKVTRLAGFPVVFGAENYEMILSRSALELLVPTYDPNLREHLKEYGERLKQETSVSTPGLRGRIEGILSDNLPGRIVPAEEMAANLGMSRRTFARRLKEKDLSFREIVDDLRSDLARTYLKDGFSIAEISFYLDYGDQAAFSTAFKRWTGLSPSDYRARNLSG